ncbi:FxsB family cyclophane-forming radical SAM/SPASM peptide maturase [Streptomyces sp. NPDC002766]|uniref:FxsB family cyclophane-forming radical SAM/SPASM peptide maturase n=1 Tax=Streptomyces sp. NPDC002766 TaxID=3154429 RepID=UPI00331889B6
MTEDGRARLTAFDQFTVKLHSRCNLACDYCYVYELRDTSWRERPRTMPRAVREKLAERIAEHVRRHGLERIRVILHGGEPLLAGATVIDEFATSVRQSVEAVGGSAEFALQTNGTLLSEPMLDVLHRHDVRVGVSLDGDAEAHDRHRAGRGKAAGAGRGSHARVTEALELLGSPRHRRLFGGLLCTVDPANPPRRTYEALATHRPPAIDFLLPHATWDFPPAGADATHAPYGDWLCEVFDHWESTGRLVPVRLFDSVVTLLRYGSGSGTELLGMLPAANIVIESEGALVWTDSLNAVADRAGHTGANIFGHSFDDLLALPELPETGIGTLCSTCRSCPHVDVCGGGLQAHRFGAGRGFHNPSVYCLDLTRLIRHIHRRIQGALRDVSVSDRSPDGQNCLS